MDPMTFLVKTLVSMLQLAEQVQWRLSVSSFLAEFCYTKQKRESFSIEVVILYLFVEKGHTRTCD